MNKKKKQKIIYLIVIITITIIIIFSIKISDYLDRKSIKQKCNLEIINNSTINKFIGKKKQWGTDAFGHSYGDKNLYVYRYEATSKNDKIIYGINYIKDNDYTYCINSYSKIKEIYDAKEKILESFDKNINSDISKVEIIPNYKLDTFYTMFDYDLIIYNNQDLDKLMSKEYIDSVENARKEIFETILNKYHTNGGGSDRLYYSDNSNLTKITLAVGIRIIIKYKDDRYIDLDYSNGSVDGWIEMHGYIDYINKKR